MSNRNPNHIQKSRPIELLMDNGKFSRTGLMFLVWMVFFMVMIGIVTLKSDPIRLADVPEPYVYLTLVLCGTYTARKFLDDKYGKVEPAPTPVIPQPTPYQPPYTPPYVPPVTTTTTTTTVPVGPTPSPCQQTGSVILPVENEGQSNVGVMP